MSLFENSEYEWRETYFVLFDRAHVPQAEQMNEVLQSMGNRIEVSDMRTRDDGSFESITVYSPGDFAAMDITCASGEEVQEQLPELVDELRPNCETEEEKKQLEEISGLSARMDIYHFEKNSPPVSDSVEIDFMDPGGLLMVLDRIAELCKGVVIDPQTSSLM